MVRQSFLDFEIGEREVTMNLRPAPSAVNTKLHLFSVRTPGADGIDTVAPDLRFRDDSLQITFPKHVLGVLQVTSYAGMLTEITGGAITVNK